MARSYNFIYDKLVSGENDIIGHVAYSLYKSGKIDFIESFKKKNGGKEPSEDDFRHFHEACCVGGSIDGKLE